MKLFNLIALVLLNYTTWSQSGYVTLEDSTKLYVTESGKGQTLLFIPGWTMTHRFFENQTKYLSDEYHVLTYDPRGQGRSDKTNNKNSYSDHAVDLKTIIDLKELKDIVLIGWSSGCLTVHEYIRQFGFSNIDKIVLIDEPPKWVGDPSNEWVYGTFDDYRSSLKHFITGSRDPDGIIDWMLNIPVDSKTRKWMKEEMLMTPSPIAMNLFIDGLISDYQTELIRSASEVPTMVMLRSDWSDASISWLNNHTPQATVQILSSHAMFWEKPQRFNTLLISFINSK